MSSPAYETQITKLRDKLAVHKDYLVQMCLSDSAHNIAECPTEVLSSLASDPYIGLLPEEDVNVLLKSLLWLRKVPVNDPVLQQKAKNWASVQLRNMIQMPLKFVEQYPHIQSLTMPEYLTMMLSTVEEHVDEFVKTSDPSNLSILCRIGMMALKQKCLGISVVESILTAFWKSKQFHAISNHPETSQFFDLLSESIKHGNVKLSSEAAQIFLSYHKKSVKALVVTLLTCASAVHDICDVGIIQASLKNSELVLVCSAQQHIFQYALAIMICAWKNSEGHPGLGFLIESFVAETGKHCSDIELVSLFPENIRHLTLLFSLHSLGTQKSSPTGDSNSIQEMIDASLRILNLGICTSNDLSILMVIFPFVYHKCLVAAVEENNLAALSLLKSMWKNGKSRTDEEIFNMARRLLHNVWLAHNVHM